MSLSVVSEEEDMGGHLLASAVRESGGKNPQKLYEKFFLFIYLQIKDAPSALFQTLCATLTIGAARKSS